MTKKRVWLAGSSAMNHSVGDWHSLGSLQGGGRGGQQGRQCIQRIAGGGGAHFGNVGKQPSKPKTKLYAGIPTIELRHMPGRQD